jgi:hypothetical protein
MSDSKKPAPREEAKVRVRHLNTIVRDGVQYPAGSFEEEIPERVAAGLVATGHIKRLGDGDLPGDNTPTEGADHTVARPPSYEALDVVEPTREFAREMDRRAAAESAPKPAPAAPAPAPTPAPDKPKA